MKIHELEESTHFTGADAWFLVVWSAFGVAVAASALF